MFRKNLMEQGTMKAFVGELLMACPSWTTGKENISGEAHLILSETLETEDYLPLIRRYQPELKDVFWQMWIEGASIPTIEIARRAPKAFFFNLLGRYIGYHLAEYEAEYAARTR